jgi:CBS domain containing-hemolysin-like protein
MVVTVPILIVLAVLLALSAALSAMEAALLGINKVRLRHLAESGNRSAQLTYDVLARLDKAIGTLLFVDTLVETASSAIGTWIFVSWFGPQWGLVLATLVMTVTVLVMGEMVPKLFATTHSEGVAFLLVRPLRSLMGFVHPVSAFFSWCARMLLRLARVPLKPRASLITEEEIKVMIQMGREAGILAEQELRLLHRIFEFSDSLVGQVMIPRDRIAGVDLSAKSEDALDVIVEEGHSRIPIYRGTIDEVVGVIYARDMLTMMRHGKLLVLSDLIRPVARVTQSERIAELLSQFQRDKTQIAIVQDADGKTVGLVTIEDLLEEIVGEIEESPRRWRA